jgi:hypothetical protein
MGKALIFSSQKVINRTPGRPSDSDRRPGQTDMESIEL